ncbi:hypothetical protein MAM1_1128c11472 [Mucor ambiguus]|uniref:Uncharacterized protein n=1 Tax=Mucor ambiguus TaxID=91626 RepID=A0A0C9MM59_9FUNG|nr:hypothetical protein MAM1_1128c11472 [Mucor ambiguus]
MTKKPKGNQKPAAPTPVELVSTDSLSLQSPDLDQILEGIQNMLTPLIDSVKTLTSSFTTLANRTFDLESELAQIKEHMSSKEQLLQAQIDQMTTRLDAIEQENLRLRTSQSTDPLPQEPETAPAPIKTDPVMIEPIAPDQTEPTAEAKPTFLAQLLKPAPPSDPRRLRQPRTSRAGLRLFTTVSSNQGFTHLYLPVRSRLPFKRIREELRKAKINTSSILDIFYPASKVVCLLIHNDYVSTAVSLLEKEKLVPILDFNPIDPRHLADPKYQDANLQERTAQMQLIHQNQITRTLNFLRSPVKLAVARDYQRKGWISSSYINDLLRTPT